ncbi:MAG: methyltransferase domain-containing protein [Anaerolineaceae bacterium]|nr:methyltransferase domain-containing protein [Anaerolineaceae bacterium]
MSEAPFNKAALRGVPSLVWRAGQERRLRMILDAAGSRAQGCILVDGCGIGTYLWRLSSDTAHAVGLDIELERSMEALKENSPTVCGAGETLPFADNTFDLVLSHEVLEHVQDDQQAVCEIVRTLRPGGRLVLFCPNRGYPFETHGIYWRGKYHFGNIPLVNYLPRPWRNRLAPHVRVYTRSDLQKLFHGLQVRPVKQTTIFGAYDNIIVANPALGRFMRLVLQWLEQTPLRLFGLSHFWVMEKIQD